MEMGALRGRLRTCSWRVRRGAHGGSTACRPRYGWSEKRITRFSKRRKRGRGGGGGVWQCAAGGLCVAWVVREGVRIWVGWVLGMESWGAETVGVWYRAIHGAGA